MEKNLYIDASHPDETRVVLKSSSSIEEYEYENKNKLNFKNNIYLGVVSRVEPSLQAAFVNFGRDRTNSFALSCAISCIGSGLRANSSYISSRVCSTISINFLKRYPYSYKRTPWIGINIPSI